MTINRDLFIDILAHIDLHPEQWNQGTFYKRTRCGTSYCFAGWAVHLNRVRMPVYDKIAGIAEDLLGIKGWQWASEGCRGDDCDACALCLFSTTNSRHDLDRISAKILGLKIKELKSLVQDRLTELRTIEKTS